jgi:hypothetical protein
LLPTFPHGNFTDPSSLTRKEIDYWRDLAKLADQKYCFLFNGPSRYPAQITVPFAEKMTTHFKKRKLAIWDSFPAPNKDTSTVNVSFLKAYEGRERGLDKFIEGVLIKPEGTLRL